MYLLDTNVVSELRKNKPHDAVIAWFTGIREDEIFLSAVTFGELQAGIELTRRQNAPKAKEIEEWVDKLAAAYTILPMDSAIFREWARLMNGQPDQLSEDAMLAATARVHRLALVTRNSRDFETFDVPLLNPFSGAKQV
jgi:toxin FitB